jgi:hypothetical protein
MGSFIGKILYRVLERLRRFPKPYSLIMGLIDKYRLIDLSDIYYGRYFSDRRKYISDVDKIVDALYQNSLLVL